MKLARAFAILGCIASIIFAKTSFAAVQDGFFFKPFLTLEYAAPKLSGGGVNPRFQNNVIGKQIKKFENIALGFHGRIHKFVGINVNWSQMGLSSAVLQGHQLSQKSNFGLSHYDFSTQFFVPLVEDSVVEFFGEVGVSSMKSHLTVFDTDGSYAKNQSSETHTFFGVGAQYAPFNDSNDVIRISAQRYNGKLQLLDTNLTLIKIGYAKEF